jgi:hypothetical protein
MQKPCHIKNNSNKLLANPLISRQINKSDTFKKFKKIAVLTNINCQNGKINC